MTTYRTRPQQDFTTIRNAALRDERLSLKAKGLLAMMLTFPSDWTYRQSHLEKLSTDGRDALRAAVRELEACGYIRRHQTRSEDGRVGTADYVVDDNPTVDGFSGDGKTGDGLSGDGKPATTNTEGTKTEVYEEGSYEPPPSPPRADPEPDAPGRGGGEDLRELFNENARQTLQRTDRPALKLLDQAAADLGWRYAPKNMAATALLESRDEAVEALRATVEGCDNRGGKAYNYFKSVLANASAPRASPPKAKQWGVEDSPSLKLIREMREREAS